MARRKQLKIGNRVVLIQPFDRNVSKGTRGWLVDYDPQKPKWKWRVEFDFDRHGEEEVSYDCARHELDFVR